MFDLPQRGKRHSPLLYLVAVFSQTHFLFIAKCLKAEDELHFCRPWAGDSCGPSCPGRSSTLAPLPWSEAAIAARAWTRCCKAVQHLGFLRGKKGSRLPSPRRDVLGDLPPFHLGKRRLQDLQGDAGESRSPRLSTPWQEKPVPCPQRGFVSPSQQSRYCE